MPWKAAHQEQRLTQPAALLQGIITPTDEVEAATSIFGSDDFPPKNEVFPIWHRSNDNAVGAPEKASASLVFLRPKTQSTTNNVMKACKQNVLTTNSLLSADTSTQPQTHLPSLQIYVDIAVALVPNLFCSLRPKLKIR